MFAAFLVSPHRARSMMSRGARALAPTFFAFLMLAGSHAVWAADVWVALSSKDAAYVEAAEGLRASLPGHVVQVRPVDDIKSMAKSVGLPDVLVAVGGEALQQLSAEASRLPGVPLVAMMTSRTLLDDSRASVGSRLTGVYLDQPYFRQFELLRRSFPSNARIGILLGPASASIRGELAFAAKQAGLTTVFRLVQDKSEFGDALQDVLADVDVLLAVPDPVVYNSQTAKFILLKAYRRGVPLIGYSTSFVKAGAAAAIVSTPAQNGREAASMVLAALAGRALPAPSAPDEFEVEVNSSVARSLGLNMNADALKRALRAEGARR